MAHVSSSVSSAEVALIEILCLCRDVDDEIWTKEGDTGEASDFWSRRNDVVMKRRVMICRPERWSYWGSGSSRAVACYY